MDSQHAAHLVRTTLEELERWIRPEPQDPPWCSEAAVRLILGTAAAESGLGRYWWQVGSDGSPAGPAVGWLQIEPGTHRDLWRSYLAYRPQLRIAIGAMGYAVEDDVRHELLVEPRYSVVVARMLYRRAPRRLPHARDLSGLATYWKDFYNTHLGAGSIDGWLEAWRRHIGDLD
jgi:hypothetical protein